MKQTILFITMLFIAHYTSAQNNGEYRISQSQGTLVLSGLDDVKITGYDGSEIIISIDDYENEVDERAAGLKIINSLGLDDNSGIGLSVKQEGSVVTATQIASSCDSEFEIQIPNGVSVEYEHSTNQGGDVTVENVSGELVISTSYGDVHLENVTGPMAVKSIYGSIEAIFGTVSQTGSISLHSVYDLIDVTIPSSTNADIDLKTPWGEIYSNMDINVDDAGGRMSQKSVSGSLNSGGVEIDLKSGYDNIYLRKK